MFEYGDKEEYVREQASKHKGRNVQEAWGIDRGEGAMDSNMTLLSDYLDEITGLETPSESIKHKYACQLPAQSSHDVSHNPHHDLLRLCFLFFDDFSS